ncbi:WSC domain-containing protein [Cucurbitaria berberidis CBS 394.84]|uniref:WSC domain-containing protein n=1 Tax=Cucurbitaria berberidis CBS 394.84 TaxID=1168544 RepID=A0A9P4GMX2_9PLEO|nr:WSC domain-containing protein [Cucurbitaria berberidis CBS 394.84]KAF1848139.1 WSC domain-containing protein [Cucurbitaria berberidis CBS 394.84]
MKSAASLSVAAALLSGADAFWRMPCTSRTALARLDPIVDVGVASSHGHTIHGGSNFAERTSYDDLRKSECTSCQFSDDKSAYWTPSLHFVHDGGSTEIVPQIGGMLAYYQLIGTNLKAFPKDFQAVAGDSRLRNFTGPVPDPPTSAWTDDDMTQVSLGQKAIGFNCMNYNKNPEPSRYRHFLPSKDYLDENCADGIRAEIMFPSCWNGKDTDSPDHRSHIAYPNNIAGGQCPPGFETRLPSLFYETIWNTNAFKGKSGQFVWSNGDPTGYGYHADFINGWNIDTLQAAVNDCTSLSGLVEDCPHFAGSLQTQAQQGECKIKDLPKALDNDDCAGPAKGLCGNVPVQYGPGYANALKNGGHGKEPTVKPTLSSAAPVPTQSYASAKSKVEGVDVYNVQPSSAAASVYIVVAAAKPTPAYKASPAAPEPIKPTVTVAADIKNAPKTNEDGSILSTTTYTSAGTVYEVAIKEVAVTVTVEEPAKYKNRRHAHLHRKDRLH